MKKYINPQWREFEKLVAHIEASLAPKGAIVRSPDYILDKQTDRLREVDASIRFKVGSADILITVECRRRKDRQDVTWIEQLATKKKKIGASETLAITNAGLSAPAIKTARQENIVVRTLNEVEKDSFGWSKLKFHKIKVNKILVRHFEIDFYDVDNNTILVRRPEIMKHFKDDQLYPYLIRFSDGARFDLFEPLREANRNNSKLYNKCIPGKKCKINIKRSFSDQEIGIETNKGIKSVRNLYLGYEVTRVIKNMPINNIFRYSSPDNDITEGMSFNTSKELGLESTIILQRRNI